MRKLTPRQERFVQEYLLDLNATQAAVRAGYKEKTAYSQGQRLLKHVEIQVALQKAFQKREKRTEITQDWVLTNLKNVAERCMQAESLIDREGNPTGNWRFDAHGANKALELLGKHLGMFNTDIKVVIEKYNEVLVSVLDEVSPEMRRLFFEKFERKLLVQ